MRRLEDGVEVLEHAARLCRDVPLYELTGGRVDRDLARHEQQRAGPDCLRVGTDGLGSRRGRHRLTHHYAALTTLLDRRQRVQTRRRLIPPFTLARTRCRFGSNRRGVTL